MPQSGIATEPKQTTYFQLGYKHLQRLFTLREPKKKQCHIGLVFFAKLITKK